MRPLLRNLLLLAALSLATWAAVLGTWYAQRRVPSLDDALQYLIALPLLLFAGVLALRGWPRGAGGADATAPALDAAPRGAARATPASTAAETSFPLLAAWVHTPAGADAFTLLAALAEGQPRPRPDPLLRDADGLPVLAARIAALDAAAVQAEWPATPDAAPPSPAAQRALAALVPLLEQAIETLAAAPDGDTLAPALHVLAHWPATWSAAEAQAAQAWLVRRLAPLRPATLTAGPGHGARLLRQAQACLTEQHQAGRDARVLLLATHSDLDDASVQRLEGDKRLHAQPRRPRGLIPGEAAAALLLATRAGANAAASVGGVDSEDGAVVPAPASAPSLAPVHLRALRIQPRTEASGACPRAQAALEPLQALLDDALRGAGLERAALTGLSSDVDQISDAATALYALAQSALPHLDPMDDLHLAGTCCGHTGAVAPLLALAVAWARCQADANAGAAICLTEEHGPLAAVLGAAPSWP